MSHFIGKVKELYKQNTHFFMGRHTNTINIPRTVERKHTIGSQKYIFSLSFLKNKTYNKSYVHCVFQCKKMR